MTKTKVLIMHTSVGYGIKLTAENILEKLSQSGEFEVRIADVGQVEKGGFATVLEKAYSKILDRFAGLWGFLYSSRFVTAISLPPRKFIASFKSKNTLNLLREFQPAIVISTQAISTGVIAYLKSKGLYKGKLVAVFSDYHLHRFWLFDEVDLYACNIQKQADELKRLGVPADKIVITGLFLADKFYKPLDKEQAAVSAGLLRSMPVVFLFNGGRPRTVDTLNVFRQLLRSARSFQVVVVCGKNAELKKELEQIGAPSAHPVKIYGYSNQIDLLMAASDVMIGKTGGPTMGEAVLKKLPMVLTDIRPGHEQANLEFLLKNNIVVHARVPREAVFLAEQILDKKIRIDWDNAYKTIVQPPQSVSIAEALNRIKPAETSLKVTHYQEA